MSKLVYGCGRLTGGATEREAMDLIRLNLDAGIRHFDTAPSYGMGTAEIVVGKALRDAPKDILVTAKVGSNRERHGVVKSYLRSIKRTITGARPRRLDDFTPEAPLRGAFGAGLSEEMIWKSIALTRDRLERSQLDYLLIHDPQNGGMTNTYDALLRECVDLGAASRIGYAHGHMFDAEMDATFPSDYVAQAAISPAQLLGISTAPPARTLFLHSIVKTGYFLCRTNELFAEQLEKAGCIISGGNSNSQRVAALLVLASGRAPTASFIFSSAHKRRLKDVLDAVAGIDRNQTAPLVMETFNQQS